MAASIHQNDIWKLGTEEVWGVLDINSDAARRCALVVGLDNTTDDRHSAAGHLALKVKADYLAATGLVGAYHHNNTALPLAGIRAYKVDQNSAYAIAYFRRGLGAIPTQAANVMVRRQTATSPIMWWRSTSSFDGSSRPSGSLTFTPHTSAEDNYPSELTPLPWRWDRGILLLTMPTVLSAHPAASFTTMVGKINNGDTAQFLSVSLFPKWSLKFLGFTSVPVVTNNPANPRYIVEWQAAYNPFLWQKMDPPTFNVTTQVWDTTLRLEHPEVLFPSFTVHTPVVRPQVTD